MIDLVAQIFLSALFAVGVRWVQLHRRYEVLSVGAVNYLVAFVCGIVTLFAASRAAEGWAPGGLRAAAPALLTGGALGVSYFVAFFLLLRTLELRGRRITTALVASGGAGPDRPGGRALGESGRAWSSGWGSR